jgi:hypothetical protein
MPSSPDFIDASPNRAGLLGRGPCLSAVGVLRRVRLRVTAGGLP